MLFYPHLSAQRSLVKQNTIIQYQSVLIVLCSASLMNRLESPIAMFVLYSRRAAKKRIYLLM